MAEAYVSKGKVTFIGTTEKSGLGQKWTEPLAYTPVNFANPATSQVVPIDGSDTTVLMNIVKEDFANLGRGIASITSGSFESMQFRYDVSLY